MNHYRTTTALTTTALATMLLLGGGGMAAAQGANQGTNQGASQSGMAPQAATQGQAQVAQRLQQAEQALRQAQQQLPGSGQQSNMQPARQAVTQAQQALGQVPSQMHGQDTYKKAQQQLTEAQDAIKGQQPNPQQAANQIREAADALAALHRGMGNDSSADASGATGAQIAVQQQPPQVNVQQSAPQVTVRQPPPQVTVQQPPPQVTVQQPQPQVTVQQAKPQVNVQQQGQPQVTVEQQGRQQRPDAQHAGTSNAPAPVQSGGNMQRAAAPATPSGKPLASVQKLVGTNLVGANGQDVGEVENLLIDDKGQVRAAVVEWGGFLGIGERSAAVPIERIQLGAASGNDRARLDMSKEELEQLPRYDSARASDYGREHGWGNVRAFR